MSREGKLANKGISAISGTITTDEWLSELARLTTPKDGEGLTALEWGERLGLSTKSALIKLNQAHRKGWVKLGHRHATRLDGKPCFVPVYRVEKPKSAKG